MEETKIVKIKFIDKRYDVGNFPIELIEHALKMYFGQCDEIIVSELPSPDILIPSERDIRFKMDERGWDSYSGSYVTNGIIEIANWALSRLKELNPNINFKTK